MYPLAPRLAEDQPANSEASVYCDETNGYGHHPAFPVRGASSHERSPGIVKPSIVRFHQFLLIRGHRINPSPPNTDTLSSYKYGATHS